ncbi:MAG: universal stress protein [Euryarchaeota archaeon]|nr:universal stress protein [Euryarchaeota archaeon]
MKVLICTDGSTSSTAGIKCALEVLGKEHEYTLLFVLSEEGIYRRYKETFEEDLARIEKLFGDPDPEKAAAREIFLRPLQDYMSQAGFKTTPKVREGSVVSEILAEIDEEQYAVTVLSDGKISLMKLLPGSTLHEIVQNTKKCILLARPPSHSE